MKDIDKKIKESLKEAPELDSGVNEKIIEKIKKVDYNKKGIFKKPILIAAAFAAAIAVIFFIKNNAPKTEPDNSLVSTVTEEAKSDTIDTEKNMAPPETETSVTPYSDVPIDYVPVEERKEEIADDDDIYSFTGETVTEVGEDGEYKIYEDSMFEYSVSLENGTLCLINSKGDDIKPEAAEDEAQMIDMVKSYIDKVYPDFGTEDGEWTVEQEEIFDSVIYRKEILGEQTVVVNFMFDKEHVFRAGNIFINGDGTVVEEAEITEEEAIELAREKIYAYIEGYKKIGKTFYAHDLSKLEPEVKRNTIKGESYWSVKFNNKAVEENPDLVEPYFYGCDVNVVTGEVIHVSQSK